MATKRQSKNLKKLMRGGAFPREVFSHYRAQVLTGLFVETAEFINVSPERFDWLGAARDVARDMRVGYGPDARAQVVRVTSQVVWESKS